MEIIQVDRQMCTQCGICAATCPGALIDFNAGEYPRPASRAELACIRCGHCVAICPNGSLTHREMPVEKFPPVIESLNVTAKQCEQLLRSRRSIRAYKKEAVPRDVIQHLIEIARYAPTGHNNQDVKWLVIDNRTELDRMEKIGTEWIRWAIKNQPRMATMFDMEKMLERQSMNNNVFLRGAPALIAAHGIKDNPMAFIDCTIALTYLDLAASSHGLGCCWAGFIYFMAGSFRPMKEAIALPEGRSGYGFMMLGYPCFSYHRLPLRKPPQITWR